MSLPPAREIKPLVVDADELREMEGSDGGCLTRVFQRSAQASSNVQHTHLPPPPSHAFENQVKLRGKESPAGKKWEGSWGNEVCECTTMTGEGPVSCLARRRLPSRIPVPLQHCLGVCLFDAVTSHGGCQHRQKKANREHRTMPCTAPCSTARTASEIPHRSHGTVLHWGPCTRRGSSAADPFPRPCPSFHACMHA